MKEIELKAHGGEIETTAAIISKVVGHEGKVVDKKDQYFRKPGEVKQAFRMRNNNGILEFTAKKMAKESGFENNFEYEFTANISEWDKALAFFLHLGYEKYFNKYKKGYEWMTQDGVHVELLEVNDLGCFLEMEIIAPWDITPEEAKVKNERLRELLYEFGRTDADIEPISYRDMILKRIPDNNL